MLNRNDYRKYWVKEPPDDDACKGCHLDYGTSCLAQVEDKLKEFRCMVENEHGVPVKWAVFKLIQKEAK